MMAGLVVSIASAQQLGDYGGPSIMSRGSGSVGTRGGQTVDLRFFANVNAIYDTGLVPLQTNTSGQLVSPGGLYGVEGQVGAYGTHTWRTASLSIDYKGNFRHYNEDSSFDGSDQQLSLGYTYQKSKRLKFDFQGLVGTYGQGFGTVTSETFTESSVNPSTSILFDNRSSFFQGGMDATYILSPRNSISVGGEGYDVTRHSNALVGMHGYTLRGSFEHRLSRNSSVGLVYDHYHYDFPHAFGESTSDGLQIGYNIAFDRNRWIFKILGGAIQSEVEGLQTVQLDPVIASILGISTTVQAYYQKTYIPSGSATLSGRFKTSNIIFSYNRGVSPGNGVYLTSRQENAGASYNYTGVRKTSLGLSGFYSSFASLGPTLTPYKYFSGGASASYAVSHALHLVARFDSRYQDITELNTFKKNSYRASIGVAFSPGDIPLTLW
jgi:hypothetical protein